MSLRVAIDVHRCVGCRADASAATDHPRPPPSPHAAPGVTFRDVTASAGIAGFKHVSGGAEKNYIIEGTGSGVAFWDFDNDGYVDLYLVNGSTLDRLRRGDPLRPQRFSATKGTGLSRTLLLRAASRTSAGGKACASATSTTTASRICTSRTSARTACTTTIGDRRSAMSRTQQMSRSTAGRPAVRSATSTAMDGSTCSSPVTSASTQSASAAGDSRGASSTPRRLARLATAPRASARRTLPAHRSARIARSA